jgi:GTP-binding protein
MRRPRSDKSSIEVFSIQASTRALRQADVVFLLIGCNEGVTDQDVRLLNLIVEEGRPTAILLNFWDTLGSRERKTFVEGTDFKAYLENFHLLPTSGLEGFNCDQILPLAFRLYKHAQKRVKTSRLNEVVERIVSSNPPPNAGRQNFNILYASQVRVDPPTFVFFMNRESNVPVHYRTYLEKQLRSKLGFKGQSIRVIFRGQKSRAKPDWLKAREARDER